MGVGPPAPIPVLLRIEFTASDSLQPMAELLPRLSNITDRATLCREGWLAAPRGSGRCGGLIAIRKRDPSPLFTQHPCAVPRGSDCAVRGSFPRPAPRGIAFSRRWFPDRYRVTLSAVYLCCTFPEVAFGGRYPLFLPCGARTFLMDGLSACPRDCLFYSCPFIVQEGGGNVNGGKLARRVVISRRLRYNFDVCKIPAGRRSR